MLDASKIRDLMILGLLTKIIEIASMGQSADDTNIVSTCYAMGHVIVERLTNKNVEIDANIASQFMTDDDDDDDGNGGSAV